MLSEEERARVCVVLVRARNPNNIGAVARAMHGFGFSDLRLVNDYSVGLETARSAVDASEILAQAKQFASVPEAVADCNLVVGTTYTKKVLVENNSASKVVIGTASITTTGGDASAFSVHEYCNPRTLKSGKECVIAVTFKPEDATLDTATLNIPSNAAGSPLEVPLSGTGVNKK